MTAWRNTRTHYGWLAILIHWSVVLLIIGLYGTIEWRGFVPKKIRYAPSCSLGTDRWVCSSSRLL